MPTSVGASSVRWSPRPAACGGGSRSSRSDDLSPHLALHVRRAAPWARTARVRLLHTPPAEREPRLEHLRKQSVSGSRVVVRVSGDAELGGVRAVVQVQAVCAGVR